MRSDTTISCSPHGANAEPSGSFVDGQLQETASWLQKKSTRCKSNSCSSKYGKVCMKYNVFNASPAGERVSEIELETILDSDPPRRR